MESPPEGYPRHPPHLSTSRYRTFSTCWTASANRKCEIYSRESLAEEGGECKLKTKIANTILLLCYFDKICLILTDGLWKLRQIYIVEGGYKSKPEPVASPQSTLPHSTGNTSVKKEVGHSNTRGTSLHFQPLMWNKGY